MATADSMNREFGAPPHPWPHRLALTTTGATFVLILAGGVVTNTGSGMAVPDWPNTFGHNMFLYPWSKMVGGIFYEHVHRLIASLVGSLTLTLAVLLWAFEPRHWLRGLGVAALIAVAVQGILGGLRVVLAQEALAIVHGAFAHAFFGLVAAIALFTSPSWRAPISVISSTDARRLRHLALFTTIGLYVQVGFGTLVTHRGAWLEAHLFFAALLSVAVILLGFRIVPGRSRWPELVRTTEILRALWVVQLILGLGAYVAKFHAAVLPVGAGLSLALPVSHRLTGGLMLIASLVLALRISRRTGWPGGARDSESLTPQVTA